MARCRAGAATRDTHGWLGAVPLGSRSQADLLGRQTSPAPRQDRQRRLRGSAEPNVVPGPPAATGTRSGHSRRGHLAAARPRTNRSVPNPRLAGTDAWSPAPRARALSVAVFSGAPEQP